jgi:hypothetical protein
MTYGKTDTLNDRDLSPINRDAVAEDVIKRLEEANHELEGKV